MTIDDELRRQLARRVEHVSATADLPDVEFRAGRRRSRRRAVAGVMAASMIAAAGGVGFGLGRGASGGGEAVSGAVQSENQVTDSSTTTAPPGRDASGVPEVPVDPPPNSPRPPSDDGGPIKGGVGVVGGGWSVLQGQTGVLLSERTTASGFTLRVQKGQEWEKGDYGVPGWQPADYCMPAADLRVAVWGNGVVDVGATSWFRAPYAGLSASELELGWPDNAPMRVLVVQVGTDVTSVKVTYSDGATDEATAQNGVVVLAVTGARAATTYTLDVGRGSATTSVSSADLADVYGDEAYQDGCSPPPPALPDAGEQPADPAAAEAEIRARFDLAYDHSIAAEDKPDDLFDDPTGIAEARAEVDAGAFAESARTAQVEIDELVFTAPDEAWFRYSIHTDISDFGDRFGTSHLIEGTWRISRATVCQDVALAGAACIPKTEPVLPPGADVVPTTGTVIGPDGANVDPGNVGPPKVDPSTPIAD